MAYPKAPQTRMGYHYSHTGVGLSLGPSHFWACFLSAKSTSLHDFTQINPGAEQLELGQGQLSKGVTLSYNGILRLLQHFFELWS